MILGMWVDGEVMPKEDILLYSSSPKNINFIMDLSKLLAELHQLPYDDLLPDTSMFRIVDKLEMGLKEDNWKYCREKAFTFSGRYSSTKAFAYSDEFRIFCETSIKDFRKIQDNFTGQKYLHGDLWYQNIIVTERGRLNGIIDWKNAQSGDPHWDMRMLRRWIGWKGLNKLIIYYNASTGEKLNIDHIRVLDKIALCHSYVLRSKKGNPDKPASVIQDYIQHWPESLWQK